MKKMSKKEIRESLIIIGSFLSGCIVTIIITTIFQTRPIIEKYNTAIYEKSSLAPSIDKIKDAAVTIETYSGTIPLSTGSGFIYKKKNNKAYILTNEHNIDGNIIKIITSTDKIIDGKLLGKDAYLDLAIIEIDAKEVNQVATIGNSEKSNIGDTIYTIGTPIGRRYNGSVSVGVLSGKDRIVQTTVVEEEQTEWVMKVLQFDAAINPGNSGGPLLNVNGEVIGICTMKLIKEDIEGMAFAIPIEYAMIYVENLEKGKTIKRPSLGLTIVDVDSFKLETEKIEIKEGQDYGAVVTEVQKNGSSQGILKKGDIIIEMDGQEVKDTSYAKFYLFQHKVGEKIKIKVIRNNQEKEVEITLKEANE